MITDNKMCKLIFMVFSLLCGAAAAICLLCDLAINKRISWSAYVLSTVAFVWVIVSPLIMANKDRLMYTIAAFTLAIFPYLFVLDKLTHVSGWFSALAVPITFTVIAAVVITYLSFRFIKTSKWYLSAGIVFLYGIVVNSFVQYFVSVYTVQNFFGFNFLVNLVACIVIVVLLAIIGYYRSIHIKNEADKLSD